MKIWIDSRKPKTLIQIFAYLLALSALYYYIFGKNKIINQKVLIVFSISPEKCIRADADEILKKSYLNKQQYAKIKGYDIIFNNRQLDPKLTNRYNKISLLLDLLDRQSKLNETNRYEWFLWIDSDALVVDMAFDIPFYKYMKYNFILWGDNERFARDRDGWSLNSGVFLLRNNDWSRRFLEIVATFGHMNRTARLHELKSGMRNYDHRLQDQNGIAYTLAHYSGFKELTFFENIYGLTRYWKSGFMEKDWFFKPHLFIIHFSGCDYCTRDFHKDGCIYVWNFYFNKSISHFNKLNK